MMQGWIPCMTCGPAPTGRQAVGGLVALVVLGLLLASARGGRDWT